MVEFIVNNLKLRMRYYALELTTVPSRLWDFAILFFLLSMLFYFLDPKAWNTNSNLFIFLSLEEIALLGSLSGERKQYLYHNKSKNADKVFNIQILLLDKQTLFPQQILQ